MHCVRLFIKERVQRPSILLGQLVHYTIAELEAIGQPLDWVSDFSEILLHAALLLLELRRRKCGAFLPLNKL